MPVATFLADTLNATGFFGPATGKPALELRMLATRLAIEPVEDAARRAAVLVADIEREIPEAAIAAAFAAAEPVQLVRRLAPADAR